MDSTPALRCFMIHNLISDGPHLKALLTDDRELETYVRGRVVSAWHPSGSCRMGAEDNPLSVVDPTGRESPRVSWRPVGLSQTDITA